MELLPAGDHVEAVELLRLVTPDAFVPGVTPAASVQEVRPSISNISISSGSHTPAGGDAVPDLALAVKAGAGVAVGAGGGHAGVEAIALVHTVGI